jgi:hypothetical protein
MKTHLVIYSILLISSSAFAKDIQCINSSDGKPVIENQLLICDLRTSSNNKSLLRKTFGLVQTVEISSDIRLKVNPQELHTVLGEDKISLPAHPVSANLIMRNINGKGQVLHTTMIVNPVLTKTGEEICDLKFIDFQPNISNFQSPDLPSWILKGIEKTLNKNQSLHNKVLKIANQAAAKLRAKSGACE